MRHSIKCGKLNGTLTAVNETIGRSVLLSQRVELLPVMLMTPIISRIFQPVVPTGELFIVETAPMKNTNNPNDVNSKHSSKKAHCVTLFVYFFDIFYCVTFICLLPNYL
jgi:hypothetical protein